jgi:1-deoxy-D-xylulose-5-phosphate reductoisomerase
MRFAIQYALTWPDRVATDLPELDLTALGGLTFHGPDEKRFRCLALARQAALRGGTCPAVLNGANEVAVAAFLEGRISFSGIARTVEEVLGRHDAAPDDTLDAVLVADAWARRESAGVIAAMTEQ